MVDNFLRLPKEAFKLWVCINKNNVSLKPGEDKVLYDFIMNNWMEVYKGDSDKAFSKLKGKVSDETYNNGIKLFNEFKNKFRN